MKYPKNNLNNTMPLHPDSSLTDTEEEILSLVTIGLKETEARLLVVLFREFDQTAETLMQITGLNCHEVHRGMVSMLKCRWVRVRTLINSEDLPVKIYSLRKPAEEVIRDIKTGAIFGYSPDEML